METAMLALVVLVLVASGVVKGTIGFGLPLVAVSILTQFLPAESALALMILPVVFSNLFLGVQGRLFGPSLRRFWPVVIAVCSGIMLSANSLSHMPQQGFLVLLGSVVVTFALAEHFKLTFTVPAARERIVGIAAGLFGGLLGGISTAFGPPLIMYLTALRLPKAEYVAAIGAIWTFASLTLIVAFHQSGIMDGERASWSLAACVPVGVGLWIGSRLRDRIPQAPFTRLVRLALLLLGVNLIRRGLQ